LFIVEQAWLVIIGVGEDSQEFVTVRGSGSTIVLFDTRDSACKRVLGDEAEYEEIRKCWKKLGHGVPTVVVCALPYMFDFRSPHRIVRRSKWDDADIQP